MCGIAGVFGDLGRDRIRRMTTALHHRGPDQGGYYHGKKFHLGIRRLSIIDLKTGDQPVKSADGQRAIVMNGEIYNYRQLRRELIHKGHQFETESDTEVVLRAFEEYGENCVEHLRGMFAFAIADGDRLFVARDRLGIKPLFYCHLPEHDLVLFASEIKALLQCREVPTELDPQAIVDIALFRHLSGPETSFRHIHSLEPGSILNIRRRAGRVEISTQRYYRPCVEPREGLDFEQEVEVLRQRLDETVEAHLVADVEVGVLLSGGLDSGLLAAMMNKRVGGRLLAFTTGVSPGHSDLALGKQIAASLGARHEVVQPTLDEYMAAIPQWILSQETPCSLSGLIGLLLCRHVGQRVKVCLNGEGSDEIFGGYREFMKSYEAIAHLRHNLPRLKALGFQAGRRLTERVQGLVRARQEGWDAYLRKLFEWHLGDPLVRQHLDLLDRVGMAASLEIRVPFVDHQLVEYAASLPISFKVDRSLGIKKHILKRVALDNYSPVLSSAALRSKVGLPSSGNAHRNYFDRFCRERLGEDYLRTHEWGEVLGDPVRLLLFELFQTIFVENRGEVPTGLNVEEFIEERAARVRGGVRGVVRKRRQEQAVLV